jgi:ubiquinone/menaquinone biosynthesis C-methylase UbiE
VQRLADANELIDGPLDLPTLAGNLRDLERVNRFLGGVELSWRALARLRGLSPGSGAVRLLDLGTGAGDIPRALLRRAEASHLLLEITATDVRPQIVDVARSRSAEVAGLTIALAGPQQLEFGDASFDVAHASMVLHHLEPAAVIELLAEMRRVARLGVIVNDLDRKRRWWLGSWLLSRLATGNRYTRYDGPLSVRRAYHPVELAELAQRAGLREVAGFWTRPAYRYAIVFTPS